MSYYTSANFTDCNDHQLLAIQVEQQSEICDTLGGIRTQLTRIADSLERADNKTKEEMLSKVKQVLEE